MMTINRIVFLLFLIPAMTAGLTSCYYDKEESLYPFSYCDTTNVTYSQTLAPLFSANCNSCHSGAQPTGGISLDSWAGVQVVVSSGQLLPAIEHTGPFPMPQGGSKLSDCNIAKIRSWISKGAPDN